MSSCIGRGIYSEALALCITLLLAAGCGSTPAPSAPADQPFDAVRRVLCERDCDEAELPLVLALPGRGDTPERFATIFDGLEARARLLVLRPPIQEHDGYAWFLFLGPDVWARVARDVEALSDRVAAMIARERRRAPAVVVTGFSQGAMVVSTLAVRHPESLSLAIPVSGALVERTVEDVPLDPAQIPPIVVLHGRRDEVIPMRAGRQQVETLRSMGIRAELVEHDATHWIAGEMQRDLLERIARALAPEPGY